MTPEQKLQLYRKLETDMSAGILFAIDIFNEQMGAILEQKKQEFSDALKKLESKN